MNSSETLTCNLLHLPQDIFRVIFQYLSVKDLMEGEQAFLNNQELLSLYRSALEGFTLKRNVMVHKEDEKIIYWITNLKLLVETLVLYQLRDLEINLLHQIRSSLKSMTFMYISPVSDNSIPVISQLGHFPSLISVDLFVSYSFANDQLLSFFSHNPQLEIVRIESMHHLSNEIIPHLANSCPKIKILSLLDNDWVDDETISLLTQQTLLPNLKSLNIRYTEITNQESLRQFILSHPLLSGILLPDEIESSDDFLVFYLRQVIFPSILSQNNDNDFESHSLAILSLKDLLGGILDERYDVVTPELFSVDFLSHLYRKDCSFKTLDNTIEIFSYLSKPPSMIDSILQSQFIPFILNYPRPDNYILSCDFVDILCNCGVFHDYLPLFVQKCQTHPFSLIWIFHRAVHDHFSLLTIEELQTMIQIVLIELPKDGFDYNCLNIITKLLYEPSSQLLIDPNNLLLSFKSITFPNDNIGSVINCLEIFISVNENYQRLFIESNLFPRIMTFGGPSYLISFTKHCLLSSRDGLLVDHLVDSGLFQYLLSKYVHDKKEIESLFKRLIESNPNKYSEIVREMELPGELRSNLF